VLLLKTSSSSGPISVLNAVAFERDPGVRRHLLSFAAANTPTNQAWWVLQGAIFQCFRSEDEWRANISPRVVVNLRQVRNPKKSHTHTPLFLTPTHYLPHPAAKPTYLALCIPRSSLDPDYRSSLSPEPTSGVPFHSQTLNAHT
jgi:hypothetical protein